MAKVGAYECLFVGEAEIGDEDQPLDPIRVLTETYVRTALQAPGSAVILGSRFVSRIKRFADSQGWTEGKDYCYTRLEVQEELFWDVEDLGVFFYSVPLPLLDQDLHQALVNDAIGVFGGYSGPRDIGTVLSHLSSRCLEYEIINSIMPFCQSIILVDGDGSSFRLIRHAIKSSNSGYT
jgi:hypothetical protein